MSEWQAGFVEVPKPIELTEEQKDDIRRNLRSIGLVFDPFASPALPKELQDDRFAAAAMFSALLQATKHTHKITMSFSQWCRSVGLKHV